MIEAFELGFTEAGGQTLYRRLSDFTEQQLEASGLKYPAFSFFLFKQEDCTPSDPSYSQRIAATRSCKSRQSTPGASSIMITSVPSILNHVGSGLTNYHHVRVLHFSRSGLPTLIRASRQRGAAQPTVR
jgi:hypothetical protein